MNTSVYGKEKKMNLTREKGKLMRFTVCFTCVFVLVCALLIKQQSFASWKRDDGGVKYQNSDGEYETGFSTIKGKQYYFDTSGYRQTGKFYVESEAAYYYANNKGVIQTGLIQTEDTFYLTDSEGKIKTGFVENENNRYYFNQAADMVTGWFQDEKKWYYADETGIVKTGFITLEGYRYYLGEDGVRVSNTVMEIDGVTYVFNQDGSVDENATTMYPVYQYVEQLREQAQSGSTIKMNTKIQSCAIIRAAELEDGYTLKKKDNSLETLLKNRGIKCDGGYEFSYGGIKGYTIEQLLSDMSKDGKLLEVLSQESVTELGLGFYEKDDIYYYDLIFVQAAKKE